MYKQAAIIALEETIDLVADYMPLIANQHNANTICRQTANEIKARAITGINIAKRLLEEPDTKEECEVHIIQMDATDMPDPFKTMLCKLCEGDWGKAAKCPRCGNEEICPGDKFCKICGMALMAGKEAE